MITYKLKINCQEPRVLVSDMEFVAGDVNAYRLEFTFYDNGEKISLSDKTLTVKGRRADGTILSGSGQIDGTQAVFVPANAFYAVPGELILEIALTDGAGNYMTTKILSAAVLESLGEPTEMATTNVSAYVTLLHQLTNRLDNADQLIAETKLFYESELKGVSDFMKNKPAIENGEGVGSLVGVVPDSLIEDETDFANTATADNAVTFGKSNSNSGKRSVVAGKGNINIGANNIVAGQYNTGRENTLLELGNGVSESNRSNAFEVYTDGSISLDNGKTKLTPAGMKHLVTLKAEVDDLAEHTEELQSNTEQAILDVQNQCSNAFKECSNDLKECSNALKANASGAVIRMDDVSPVAHTMKVTLSGEKDVTTVTVDAFGKNLLPYPYAETSKTSHGITFTDNGDGSITLHGTATGYAMLTLSNDFNFVAGVTYAISGGGNLYINYLNENGEDKYFHTKYNTTLTWDKRYTLKRIYLQVVSGVTKNNEVVCPMIEVGSAVTEYEPYKEPTTYTANADGVVEGVTSMHPNMTITTDTEGVVVDCAYNRDLNKAFAILQQAIISLGGNV